jgi:N-formylglutamate amidohydrolase
MQSMKQQEYGRRLLAQAGRQGSHDLRTEFERDIIDINSDVT